MLKAFRHLRDEIVVVQEDLAKYPDPEDGLRGAGKNDWYADKLADAYASVTACVDRFEKAYGKVQEELHEEGWTEEGHADALAARSAEANQVDLGGSDAAPKETQTVKASSGEKSK